MLKQLFKELRVAAPRKVSHDCSVADVHKSVMELHPSAEGEQEVLSYARFFKRLNDFRITGIADIKRCYI